MNCRLPLLFSFILAVSFQGSNTHVTPDVVYVEEFLSGMRQFSGDLYKGLIKNHEGNAVISPIDAMVALNMAGYGTEGETQNEISAALHLPTSEGLLLRNYRKLLMDILESKGVEIHLANKLFIQNGLELEWVFKHVMDVIFQTSTQNVDFGDTSSAAATINNWSKEKTNDKIPEIVSAADVDNVKLGVASSAYFKGQWVNSFGSDWVDKVFHLDNNNHITIPMMCNEMQYNYGLIPGMNARYVEVPIESKDSIAQYSMFFLYPNDVNGVNAIGEKMGEINFVNMISPKKPLKLCMPKFELTSDWDLIPAYQNMGVNQLFSDNANLRNMGRFENLKVGSMKQKASISIDENGTEAVADSSTGAGPNDADSMTLDHPFMAMVILRNPGAPVMMARITNPHL